MSIPARLLRHTCTFQLRAGTKSATSGQVNYTWADAQTDVPCRLDEASGREYPSESGKYVKADHILFVNQADVTVAITEKDYKVICDGNTYNILLISDAGGAGRHYEIALERIY